MSLAVSFYAPGVEAYANTLNAQALYGARPAQPAEPLARLDSRSEFQRETGVAEKQDAQGSEEPRSLRRPVGSIEERRASSRRPSDLLLHSTAFLAQFIAQALRPSAEARTDVMPHEGFAAYRLATERGIAYFGFLDPIDFAV
ncbi:MAG TPA: hypothetical protein VJN41_07640 [Alphaproteobacteria bacterium]|nr:hypothetical protein [Alphaproteobacteria bacterium]